MSAKNMRTKISDVPLDLGCFLALALICVTHLEAEQKRVLKQAVDAQGAPIFRVDPFWPKPLPNRWSMQQVTGLYVEQKTDHIWF